MYVLITACFILGLGSTMISLTTVTTFGPYFDKRKALSLGITTAGGGVGMLVLSLILRYFFDNYSFSGAMLLLGNFYRCLEKAALL